MRHPPLFDYPDATFRNFLLHPMRPVFQCRRTFHFAQLIVNTSYPCSAFETFFLILFAGDEQASSPPTHPTYCSSVYHSESLLFVSLLFTNRRALADTNEFLWLSCDIHQRFSNWPRADRKSKHEHLPILRRPIAPILPTIVPSYIPLTSLGELGEFSPVWKLG